MVWLHEYLTKIQQDPFAENVQSTLALLDERIMLVHDTYGSVPEEGKMHLRIREASWKPIDPNSIKALSLATSYLLSNFHKRVDEELCAHSVSDEKYSSFNGSVIAFKVSFLSFGEAFSSFSPNEEKKRVERALERMRSEGYIIDAIEQKGRQKFRLRDCEENRILLNQYFSAIGSMRSLSFKVVDGIILEVEGIIDFKAYVPYHTEPDCSGWEDLNKPIGKNPSEDQLFRLQSNLKKFLETTSAFFSLGEKNYQMMADLLVSYAYELESMLDYHGKVWQMEEAKHAPIRAKNRANLDQVEREKEEAFRVIREPQSIFNQFFQPLHDYIEEIGLQVEETRIFDYGLVRIKIRLPIFERKECEIYDGYDEDRSQPIIYMTGKKLSLIESLIQKQRPDFKLTQNVEARFDHGEVVLQSIYGEFYLN